jgi:hypothetical protein
MTTNGRGAGRDGRDTLTFDRTHQAGGSIVIIHPSIRRTRPIGKAAFGALAGDPLARALGRLLDDDYHYLRGVPAAGETIDTVVVGPGGTWAITGVAEHGRFRKRNGHWYRWNRSTDSWVPWVSAPIDAARMAGHRLRAVLERAAVPADVEACLLSDASMVVEWETDQRPGIHVHREPETLGARIMRDRVLTPAQVERVVTLLDPRQPLPQLAPSPR